MRFSWHDEKKASNYKKHGVTFEEAIEALSDTLAETVVDHRHPADERRFFSVGQTAAGKLVSVAFADYGTEIRIIMARMATKKERRAYEQ